VSGVVRDLCLGKGFDFIDRGVEEMQDFGGVRLYELKALAEPDAPANRHHPSGLSEREVEVLRLIAAGRSNQQIADELYISLNTVARHVAHILDKTGAVNRTGAAAYAFREGLA
jgi:DNA-binding NarL/FixJ family response regulator